LDKKDSGAKPHKGKSDMAERGKQRVDQPGWTSGLRQIYDAVVDEPLPDSFRDLLSKLDSKS
jgi:hypothetical protein